MRNDNNKMLFFRTQADEADVDGIDDQVCLPASRLVSMQPGSATTIEMLFRSVKNNDLAHNDQLSHDKVVLTVKQGDIQEALAALVQKINSNPHSDGFLVIADDTTTKDGASGVAWDDQAISAQYAHPSITGVASITIANFLARTRFPDISSGGTAPTALAASGALAVNTHYTQSVTAARAYTLPAAADGKAGDWITVLYLAAIANTVVQTYTVTTDSNFALGSTIRVIGEDATRIPVIDTCVANDDEVQLTGLDNGDCGIGTTLRFVNRSGTTDGWAVECIVEGQGAKSAASANTVFTS